MRENKHMRMFWKVMVSITCAAVISGTVGFWWLHEREKVTELKLAEAANLCRARAEQGDPKAQSNLASMYFHGRGVPQDYGEALRWYRRAADQGDAKGEDGLALMYSQGQGIPQDYSEALRWYRKAADQGYPKAEYNLGNMYYYGRGVPQDRAEAVRWYRKAADQGDEYAQRALGLKTRPGTGKKIFLSLAFLGCILLLISSRASVRNWQQGTTTLTGVFGLSWVALNLYEFSHIGILQPGSAVSAFYFTKNLLAGVFGAMLISLLWSRVAKILLIISGMLFVGFNIYAIAHYDLMRVAPVRIFVSTDGLFVGMLIVFAIDLWLPATTEQRKTESQ